MIDLKKFFAPVVLAGVIAVTPMKQMFGQSTSPDGGSSKPKIENTNNAIVKADIKSQGTFTSNTISSDFADNKDSTKTNLETLKTYDFRGRDYDEAVKFIVYNKNTIPVIVEIRGKNTSDLIKSTKKTMQDLDAKGYENLALIASDLPESMQANMQTITFYCSGKICGLLTKSYSDNGKKIGWIYSNEGSNSNSKPVFLGEDGKVDIAVINGMIEGKVKGAYQQAGAPVAMGPSHELSQ